MTRWHKIDGGNPAPRDGTLIDLWVIGAGGAQFRLAEVSWTNQHYEEGNEFGWVRHCIPLTSYMNVPDILYWMPLPPPPTGDEE